MIPSAANAILHLQALEALRLSSSSAKWVDGVIVESIEAKQVPGRSTMAAEPILRRAFGDGWFTRKEAASALGIRIDSFTKNTLPHLQHCLVSECTYPIRHRLIESKKAKGGHARAAVLSPFERSEIARKAANTRWSR